MYSYPNFVFTVPPPEMLEPPKNITAAIYTEITFSCTGRGYGDINVVWTRPPSKVTDTAVYAINRYDEYVVGTLTIPHVVNIYSGQYCCAIKNHAGSSPRRCADLNVKGTYIHMYILLHYLCKHSYNIMYEPRWKYTDIHMYV